MRFTIQRWAVAAGLGLMLISPGRASASITQVFSQLSSDSTPTSAIPAQATYTVVGSQLRINLQNLSTYSLSELNFNSDTTLTGLAFAGAFNPTWTITGTGASQNIAADGMGVFNWNINFGNTPANWLSPGTSTLLTLNMAGTTSESAFANKFSVNPPGSVTALGVIHFQAGPGGDSAFGGSRLTVTPTPEPSVSLLFGAGALGLIRARRRKKTSAIGAVSAA